MEGQSIGDAVLRFLGDSTQLDATFDRIKGQGDQLKNTWEGAVPGVEGVSSAIEDIPPIPAEVPESVEKVKVNLHEARGEAALLGEAFGIHLPRHVRNFVAELPGVGTALEAAFSATAVLFLLGAVVEVTKKVSTFLGDTLIFTAKMREQTAELIRQNVEIAKQSDLYRAAASELEKISDQRTPLQKLTDQLKALNDEYDNLVHEPESEDVLQAKARRITEQIKLLQKQIELQKEADEKESNKKSLSALKEQIALQKDLTLALVAYREAEFQGQDKNNFDEVRFQAKLKALQEEKAAEEKYNADNLAGIQRLNNQIKVLMVERGTEVEQELNKERGTLNTTLKAMQSDVKAVGDIEIVPPQAVQNILIMQNAAHSLGITLRSDLVSAVSQAITAMKAYQAAGGTSTVVTDAFRKKIADLEKELNNFGIAQDKFKGKSDNTWKGAVQDWKNGAQSFQNLSHMGTEAFDQLAGGLQSAIQTAILAQGSFSQAMKRATEDALASLASQAIVKALFYTAEGFAALASFDGTSAGQYFTAAGEMAAVGAAAGLAAHAMAGSGSSSSNHQQGWTSQSNTSQGNRSGGSAIGIQQFATGGLISAPTLAIMGEQYKREAVLPLEDPRAMGEIGKAISSAGGAGGHVHFHLPQGMIVTDHTLQKLAGKLSKGVLNGKIQLHASNSLRLTKRSA